MLQNNLKLLTLKTYMTMTENEFINSVKAYFEEIQQQRELTNFEKSMYLHSRLYSDVHSVCGVTKDDVESLGFDVKDEQMAEIADKMSDAISDTCYWDCLREIAQIVTE